MSALADRTQRGVDAREALEPLFPGLGGLLAFYARGGGFPRRRVVLCDAEQLSAALEMARPVPVGEESVGPDAVKTRG